MRLVAPMVPTVMFGVPVKPCAFVAVVAVPVKFPVTLPDKFPEKVVAVIIPEVLTDAVAVSP